MIDKIVIQRNKEWFNKHPEIKTSVLNDLDENRIKCSCGAIRFKFYKKWGGITLGKYNRVMNEVPVTYNFVCKCGKTIVLREGTFNYGKVKFGCSAGKCPFEKKKMDKGCLTCKYIFEK